jgi:UrcA family protein
VLAVGLLASAAPAIALAQGYDSDADYAAGPHAYGHDTSGVTVYAPRQVGREAATGAPIEWVSASRLVDYRDLDLGSGWGRHALRRRIEDAARSACDELDTRYSDTTEDSPPCVRTAVRNAMYEVRESNGW